MSGPSTHPVREFFRSVWIGFVNGTVLSILMLYFSYPLSLFLDLFWRHFAPPEAVDHHFSLGLIPLLLVVGAIFGGSFAMVVFPVFYYIHLRKVEFWRMWCLTFPTVLITATLGWTLHLGPDTSPYLFGYIGAFLGLVGVTVYFKYWDREPASGSGPSSDPGPSGATEAR